MKQFQKEEVIGHWLHIFRALNIKIAEDGRHCKCPMCGRDGTKGLRLTPNNDRGEWICTCGNGDGWKLVTGVRGCDFKAALELVGEVVRVAGPLKTVAPREQKLKTIDDIRRMFDGAVAYKTGDLIDLYLGNRGLTARPNQQTFLHLGLRHPVTRKKHAAICGLWQMPNGEVVGFHRTYLDRHGDKLPEVDKNQQKLMTPKIIQSNSGGAHRMMDVGESKVLGLGEGFETSLALAEMMDIPAWDCTNNILLEKFVPPDCLLEQVDHFVIAIDRDRKFAGQKSSYILANRLAIRYGKSVDLVMPDKRGHDVLDILNKKCGMVPLL